MAAPLSGPPGPSAAQPPETRRAQLSRLLIRLLAAWSAIVVSFIALVTIVGSHNSTDRAIILMACGLVLIWVVLGGLLTLRYRDAIRERVLRIRLSWPWKFFLFAVGMACLEEAVTTSMTNLAPEFGSQVGVAYITASNNYLVVIAFSSVVLIAPELAVWTWLLRKYAFLPTEVFLVYGLLGTTMEATLQLTAFLAGFWFFVYGLMVYLPAYCVPRERGAAAPRGYHYVVAYGLPLLCALPVAGADTLLAHALGIHLWGG